MYLAGFPVELRPQTLITRSLERVRAFLRELDGPAIIKPLAGFGGQNVFYVARGQTANLPQMISDGAARRLRHRAGIPAGRGQGRQARPAAGGRAAAVGDTVAAYKRMRPKDDIRNNMHVGGSRKRADFTEAEQRICDLLRPRLVADGLYFVGVDLVGDKILEINVFAPGGIHNINELYEIDVGTAIIRDLERRSSCAPSTATASPRTSSCAPKWETRGPALDPRGVGLAAPDVCRCRGRPFSIDSMAPSETRCQM